MKKVNKALLCLLIGGVSLVGYAQQTKKALMNTFNKYSGTDLLDEGYSNSKAINETRYFYSGAEVAADRTWREKIEYKGDISEQGAYEFVTKIYKKDQATGTLNLLQEQVRTYDKPKSKRYKYYSQVFLQDGLVEVRTNDGEEHKASCIDAEGNVINDSGCLYYSSNKFPVEKIKQLQSNIANIVSATVHKSKKSKVPDFIIVFIEADYESQSWLLSFEFPKKYNVNNELYSELIGNITFALNNEKLENYHFNKDINGNYYNYRLTQPIAFKK